MADDEIEDILAVPNTTLIPHFTLSPLPFADIVLLGKRLRANHLATAWDASTRLPVAERRPFMQQAHDFIEAGAYPEGSAAWNNGVMSSEMLPYLIQRCIRPTHGEKDEAFCAALVTSENRLELTRTCARFAGIRFKKEKKSESTPPTTPPNASDSTSNPSSDASAAKETASPA